MEVRFPLLLALVLLKISRGSAWIPSEVRSNLRRRRSFLPSSRLEAANDPLPCHDDVGRRKFLQKSIAEASIGLLSVSAIAPTAFAATSPTSEDESLVPRDRIASLLHAVPTFTIVDPKGVPYMVVGEDAKVTGYFFTEYAEAARILKLARTSADKAIREQQKEQAQVKDGNRPAEEEDLVNPWKEARISTVPLDFAVTLVTRSSSGGTKVGNNYFQVAPSTKDIDDALVATNKTSLAEGKVPLFYYENFATDNGSTSPLFFRKSELEAAYKKEHAGESLPPLLVTELFSVLAQLVTSKDPELKALVFVPPKESAQKAKQCQSDVPFLLGQRNIVL